MEELDKERFGTAVLQTIANMFYPDVESNNETNLRLAEDLYNKLTGKTFGELCDELEDYVAAE